MRIKCLVKGHNCRCQNIRTGDLTAESRISTEPIISKQVIFRHRRVYNFGQVNPPPPPPPPPERDFQGWRRFGHGFMFPEKRAKTYMYVPPPPPPQKKKKKKNNNNKNKNTPSLSIPVSSKKFYTRLLSLDLP